MRARIRDAALLAVSGLALVACGTAAAQAPNWQPKPDAPYAAEPDAPSAGPSSPGAPSSPSPAPDSTSPSPGPSTSGPDPNVLATDLTAPVGLVMLPDGTALVGERTTGRILQVQPNPGQPTPVVETVGGLDTSGDGGLLDLAIAPTFSETGLVYAYVTTATGNGVVTFTLGGPVTTVLTGIPKGPTGNAGRITFDPNGDLVIATGTAGAPANPTSLAGKVLRYDDVGRAATDNPDPATPVYTTGLTGGEGLCLLSAVPDGPVGSTVLVGSATTNQVQVAAPGSDTSGPITTLPSGSTGLGGCAVMGTRLFVTSLDGQSVYAADLTAPGGSSVRAGELKPVLQKTYGRLKTVVAAADGTIWMTTSNKDGKGTPTPDDDRVIRITPSGGGGGGSKT